MIRKSSQAMIRTIVLSVLLAAFGCRHHRGIGKQYDAMRRQMVRGEWAAAAAALEAAKGKVYKEEDRVMYWLNLGTLLHYAKDYGRSNEFFVKAEEEMDVLWTKSISAEVSKIAVSETIQSYAGEDFEKVLLYLYTSINQVEQGKLGNALVEARRADERLKKMLVHYDKEGELGSIYRQDAFMLWLVGLYYEMEGSLADALLAYKAAYTTYMKEYAGKFGASAPSFLREDMLRTAKLGGGAVPAAARGARGKSLERLAAGEAEVILIHGSGDGPKKEEFFFDSPMPDGYVLRIALPKFAERTPVVQGARLVVGRRRTRTELAEPVARIALKNFEHRLPALRARALARATAKYLATVAAREAGKAVGGKDNGALLGAIAGIAANVAAVASEAADLRSWSTLPNHFAVARLWVPAGPQKLSIEYVNRAGQVLHREQRLLELKAGERRVISSRTML